MKAIVLPLAIASLAAVACKPGETGTAAPKQAAPAAAAPAAAKPYPLDTCLVSGEKLGEMGDPIEIIHEGRQIKFCCEKCVPKFQQDPAKYLPKMK